MADNPKILVPEAHDGTSQRDRRQPALVDLQSVRIDERGHAELLAYVRELAARIPFFDESGAESGTWAGFIERERGDITDDDIVAYMKDPGRFDGERARWLGRPHFALLLTFLELLGHAREQLNGLTQRHLDHYYREVLRMAPAGAAPDRVAVVFRLAPRVARHHLPAGTRLQAGRDSAGVQRIYRTERDLPLSRARVDSIRSVFVDRRVTRLADIWRDGSLEDEKRFEEMVTLALGDPPSAPVQGEGWLGFLCERREGIDFSRSQLGLEDHELRTLMRLVHSTSTGDEEHGEIKRLLEKIGRSRGGWPSWSFGDSQYDQDFNSNLDRVLRIANGPPAWPWATTSISGYETALRTLERDLHAPVERIREMVGLAGKIGASGAGVLTQGEWETLERLLAEAHAEGDHEERRSALQRAAEGASAQGDKAMLGAAVRAALQDSMPAGDWDWKKISDVLAEKGVEPAHRDLLDRFQVQIATADTPKPTPWIVQWDDVYRILEVVQRRVHHLPEPVAHEEEWHGLYAFEDAKSRQPEPGSPRWMPFGLRAAPPVGSAPPCATLGFALSSPALSLSEGTRTLTLTLALDEPIPAESALVAAVASVEVTTEKRWAPLQVGVVKNGTSLVLMLTADPTVAPFAPLKGSGDPWPTLRVMLRPGFAPPRLVSVYLHVDVKGLGGLQLQHEDRALDPRKPLQPWGNQPVVGSRLYLSHPELVRACLRTLQLNLTWVQPPKSLIETYRNYEPDARIAPKVSLCLVDAKSQGEPAIKRITKLFIRSTKGNLFLRRSIDFLDVPQYPRRPELQPTRDLRSAERHLRLELYGTDLGHGVYPALAAAKARQLAIDLTNQAAEVAKDPAKYTINPPYTPTLKSISADYSTSIQIDPAAPNGIDRLLHVHPFGTSPIDPEAPRLFPGYDTAGELYIGLAEVDAPERISLLVQVAEGTSSAEGEPGTIQWSVLTGDAWVPLEVRHDGTRGLVSSGIVELDLPALEPSTLLPGDRTWLRVSTDRSPGSVCDIIDIHAQGAMLCFEDRGNAAAHYEAPLPAKSVERLLVSDARVAAVEQPCTSFGGKPPERPEHFYTRVSERLRHKQRAITPWDYERLVLEEFGQIYKAKCVPLRGEPGGVEVIVVPDVRRRSLVNIHAPMVPADLLARIQEHLAARSPSGARVVVRNATYVPVTVRLGVCFRGSWDEAHARALLEEALIRYLSPWAFDEGAELSLGGRIYANSILDHVDRLEYVDYVTDIELEKGGVLVEPTALEYHAAAEPGEVLVSSPRHHIDTFQDREYHAAMFVGIGYMKVGFDLKIAGIPEETP